MKNTERFMQIVEEKEVQNSRLDMDIHDNVGSTNKQTSPASVIEVRVQGIQLDLMVDCGTCWNIIDNGLLESYN